MEPRLRSRPASPSDYETFTRLFVELATGDPIPGRASWEAGIAPTTLFHEDADGHVVAYSFHQLLGETGYVTHVVVDPAHRGKRLGRAVMDALAALFREAGCTRWCLNVKPENTAAVRLYESVGMRPAYASTSLHFPWAALDRLPPATREVTARIVDPSEDAAIETAFDLPLGRLAASRKLPGRVVLRLLDPRAPDDARVGVASFDPNFPGSFPFRLAEPTLARAMLEAIRPHALPAHDHLGLVVEDDAPLARFLLERGASRRMEIVHYRGALG